MRRTMKARYYQGRIELQEPLDLEEGAEVTITAPVAAAPGSLPTAPRDAGAACESISETAERPPDFETQALLPLAAGDQTDAEPAEQEEEVEVDYRYISRAAADTAHLPPIVLRAEDLQALTAISTDFSFPIDVDADEESS
jgi:hypothetical protein